MKIKRDINLPPAPRHVDAMFNLRPPLPHNPRVPATAEQRVQFNALNTRLRAFAAARGNGAPASFRAVIGTWHFIAKSDGGYILQPEHALGKINGLDVTGADDTSWDGMPLAQSGVSFDLLLKVMEGALQRLNNPTGLG
jgi:hypothetical protein